MKVQFNDALISQHKGRLICQLHALGQATDNNHPPAPIFTLHYFVSMQRPYITGIETHCSNAAIEHSSMVVYALQDLFPKTEIIWEVDWTKPAQAAQALALRDEMYCRSCQVMPNSDWDDVYGRLQISRTELQTLIEQGYDKATDVESTHKLAMAQAEVEEFINCLTHLKSTFLLFEPSKTGLHRYVVLDDEEYPCEPGGIIPVEYSGKHKDFQDGIAGNQYTSSLLT